MAKVKVHVVYCGAWGYRSKFMKMEQQLRKVFHEDDVEITSEGTPGTTGWFEVQVVGGKLLHSKKNGDGYVDSDAKLEKIVKGIKEAMSA